MYLPVPQAFRLALDLESELLSLRPKWRTAARSYLELILTTLEREATSARSDLGILLSGLTEGAVNSKTAKPNVGILKDACNFIEDRLHEPIQVSDITKFCDIPNVALNRLFRTFSKTTVSQYIIERRLERASDLLRDSNLTVKLIAEQSGFPHMEHFSRTFKKHRGLSPLAYRRRFQKPD
jgi:transcriptional regulator GlxA family with amidase domain